MVTGYNIILYNNETSPCHSPSLITNKDAIASGTLAPMAMKVRPMIVSGMCRVKPEIYGEGEIMTVFVIIIYIYISWNITVIPNMGTQHLLSLVWRRNYLRAITLSE